MQAIHRRAALAEKVNVAFLDARKQQVVHHPARTRQVRHHIVESTTHGASSIVIERACSRSRRCPPERQKQWWATLQGGDANGRVHMTYRPFNAPAATKSL